MKAYKYDALVQGLGPGKRLHPQNRIYIPNVGVLYYGLDGAHSIDSFSDEQASITLAQEDIETGSPRAENITEVDLPKNLVEQLVLKNKRLNQARTRLETIADSIIWRAERADN